MHLAFDMIRFGGGLFNVRQPYRKGSLPLHPAMLLVLYYETSFLLYRVRMNVSLQRASMKGCSPFLWEIHEQRLANRGQNGEKIPNKNGFLSNSNCPSVTVLFILLPAMASWQFSNFEVSILSLWFCLFPDFIQPEPNKKTYMRYVAWYIALKCVL